MGSSVRTGFALVLTLSSASISDAGVMGRLGPAEVDPAAEEVRFDLEIEFSGLREVDFEFWSLSVAESSINGNAVTDFSVYAFELVSPFNQWNVLTDFGEDAPFESFFDVNAVGEGAPLSSLKPITVPDSTEDVQLYLLGELVFDYGLAGLAPADTFTVDVSGTAEDPTAVAAGVTPGSVEMITVDFVDGVDARTVQLPSGPDQTHPIPEPASMTLWLAAGIAGALCSKRRSRDRGQRGGEMFGKRRGTG